MQSKLGDYVRSIISDTPANLKSKEAKYFKKTIPRFSEEAVYIYSFKEEKMIYADGWNEVIGYNDEEITMQLLTNKIVAPEFAEFVNVINDIGFGFIQTKSKDLEKYSFSIELKVIHKNGSEVPFIAKVGVYSSEDGKLVSTIGRLQVVPGLLFGKAFRYSVYGPDKDEFEEELKKHLNNTFVISDKEKEALELVAKGYSFKEVAALLKVSPSAIEKRILPMYKRFEVRSLSHLVSFAYDNFILH